MSSPPDTPSLDTVFDLLSNQRRRYVLVCLPKHESLTLADLAEEVTCHERDASISDIDEEDILHVYLSLWHVHIPKLAEADVVAYDQDQDLVRLRENVDRIERVVSLEELVVEESTTDE